MYKDELKKLKSNEALDYVGYLKQNGIETERDYKNTLSEINAKAKLKSADGTTNESLGQRGLIGSGYAEYLKASRNGSYEKSKAGAYLSYMKAEQEARDGYNKYLDDYDRLQQKERDELIEYLKENKIFTAEEALPLVKDSGLTADNAIDVITRGVRSAKESAIENAISVAINRNYSYYAARRYALSLGLSYEDAMRVAKSTLDFNYSESDLYEIYSDDETYLEMVKKYLEEKKTQE